MSATDILLQGGRRPLPEDQVLPSPREVSPPEGYHQVGLLDPFEAFVGPFFERRDVRAGKGFDGQGELWAAFYIDERHVNGSGICHGGMLMSFADATLGTIAWAANDRQPCVTISMQTNFIRAGKIGDLVEVRPKLVRKTASVLFASGLYCVDGEPLFSATSVWRLLQG